MLVLPLSSVVPSVEPAWRVGEAAAGGYRGDRPDPGSPVDPTPQTWFPEPGSPDPIAPRWIEVLVDCPNAADPYTYRVPTGETVQPGDVLSVPFGGRTVGAIALRHPPALPADLDPAQVRDLDSVVGRGFFPRSYWELLQHTADYYCTPLVQVVRTALPPGLLGRSQRRVRLERDRLPAGAATFLSAAGARLLNWWLAQPQPDYTWRHVVRQVQGSDRPLRDLIRRQWVTSYVQMPTPPRPKTQQAVMRVGSPLHTDLGDLTQRQREVLNILDRHGGDLWLQELLRQARTSPTTVRILAEKGWVVIHDREVLRTARGPHVSPDRPRDLTPAQQAALQTLQTLGPGQTALLHGVTGSGKTEVYLQAIAPVLDRGQSALVLVPEIGLTPQLLDRFQARFGDRTCVYHSNLAAGERYDTWRQLLDGQAQVAIGTRSAIFLPMPNLGLIILDEEHDSSFKQDSPAPCYHARTLAQWRSQLDHCPLVLGSATPSLDSWHAAQRANPPLAVPNAPTGDPGAIVPPTIYLSLPERINRQPLPPIEVVDMRWEFRAGNRSIFSRSLTQALAALRDPTKPPHHPSSSPPPAQAMLFVQRRGHSTFVSCRSCGEALECPHCDVSLSFHHTHDDRPSLLRCHFCNHTRPHPDRCPACGSPYLKFFGSGTQRVVRELEHHFPHLRILRYDSDTTRAKDGHRRLLGQFAMGAADVLVGTQMLAKGIDLPQVTLVGIVAADGLLHLSDYRAGERTVQTLTQVAGRAGRGDTPGRVILQTYTPEHPAIAATQTYNYARFLDQETELRAALHYPPCGQLALIRLSSPDAAAVEQAAVAIAQHLQPSEDDPDPPYAVLGPAPAQVMRVARRFRWQILLKAPPHGTIPRERLAQLRSRCPIRVSLTVDIDPLNLM